MTDPAYLTQCRCYIWVYNPNDSLLFICPFQYHLKTFQYFIVIIIVFTIIIVILLLLLFVVHLTAKVSSNNGLDRSVSGPKVDLERYRVKRSEFGRRPPSSSSEVEGDEAVLSFFLYRPPLVLYTCY